MAITDESSLILPDPIDWTVMQGIQLGTLNSAMRALKEELETEAAQEGRLVMLAAATAAGIDITALGWQESQLAYPH